MVSTDIFTERIITIQSLCRNRIKYLTKENCMLSLLKKLFAKKEEPIAASWPFPTGPTKIETPTHESVVAVPTAQTPVEPVTESVAEPKKAIKPKVAAKAAPRRPRAKKTQ
jgi:hypothetical protein